MKRILIFVISVLFSTGLTAQIGIDLTEMVNAPDSGYIIITTGDEYPERGLQKYVPFDSLIPLDTIFRKADSVCFQFAYQSAPVCFPDSAIQNLAYVRDGDTIRISISGGNTISFRDSTRSDADIAQVARDSLGTLDTAYRVVDEMGEGSDSIRFEMTDGRHWAVVDSVVRQDFEKVGDTIYLTKTDTGAYMVDSRIIKVFHKGDSIVVEGNRGERWAVIDKIGGQLDDV